MKQKILKLEQGYIKTEEEDKKKRKENYKDKKKFYRVLSNSLGLGFSISLPIVGGVLLGNYLDSRFNTHPKLTLFFLFFGLILAGLNIYKITKL